MFKSQSNSPHPSETVLFPSPLSCPLAAVSLTWNLFSGAPSQKQHARCHLGSIPPSPAMCVVLSTDFRYYHSQHRNSLKTTGTSPCPNLQTPSWLHLHVCFTVLSTPASCLPYFTYSPQTTPCPAEGSRSLPWGQFVPSEPHRWVSTMTLSQWALT